MPGLDPLLCEAFGRIYPGAKVSRSPYFLEFLCFHGLSSSLMAVIACRTCLFLRRCRLPAEHKNAMRMAWTERLGEYLYESFQRDHVEDHLYKAAKV